MQTTLGSPTLSAIVSFLVIVALTLAVTYWAARRTRSTREFYAAGRSISPFQNGLALAGDYMSAASFLGITGLVALRGYDGMIYATGWLVGWPALMFLIAEPLRNLGKFTFADVVAFRLRQVPVRIAAAFGGILTLLFYVLAQMVGAGNLITLMFGLPYEWAVITVGAVMLAYVLFGGMIATTWVQIIKAILLLFGVTLLTVLVLSRFDFSPGQLYAAVAGRYGQAALEPGGLVSDPVDAISLGLALMFGLLGLPHILMRFYTVPDARAARSSVLYATGFIGYFYLIIPIVGFGASALVGREIIRKVDSGGNMAAPLIAELLGGTPFLGFIAAVAFATILAVVAGLTLAGASALSHDIFTHAIRKGRASEHEQIRVARIATVIFGMVAVVLGILFKGQNVAFMVGLAFAVAASGNFPALLLSIVWSRFNTAGAVCSIVTGALLAVVLIVLSPTIWVDLLHHPAAIFPLRNPAIVSMPVGFLAGIIASLAVREPEAEAMFHDEKLRTYLGIGRSSRTSGIIYYLQKRSYLVVAALAVLWSGCGNPNEPTPQPGAPTIACPANVTVRGVSGSGQAVTYPPATVTGGASPVTTTCTPASGAPFSVGTTAVACTAVDASARQAQCSFSVTLTPLLLSVTKYVAFGDSLTEGENGRFAVLGLGFIDPTSTYPVRLQALLNTEYPGQSITVPNRGKSGEPIADGLARLPGVLSQEHPGALLLLDGYNNLLGSCSPGSSGTAACGQAITDVAFGIRDMITIGRRSEYGVKYIFVSTLTPPGQFLGGPSDRRIANDAIVRANTQISAMVRAEGATLVDTYPTFIGHEAEYVDQDGLHLKPAGYQALAESFFNGIKNTVTSTPGFGAGSN